MTEDQGVIAIMGTGIAACVTVIGILWNKVGKKEDIIESKNGELLKLEKEHSAELREIEINNVTIMNKVIDTLNRYESSKR